MAHFEIMTYNSILFTPRAFQALFDIITEQWKHFGKVEMRFALVTLVFTRRRNVYSVFYRGKLPASLIYFLYGHIKLNTTKRTSKSAVRHADLDKLVTNGFQTTKHTITPSESRH